MNAPLSDAVLQWLLRTSLEASCLIALVLLLRWTLGPRLSPSWRWRLWALVGLKLIVPACIPAGFGMGQWWSQGEAPTPAMTAAGLVAEEFGTGGSDTRVVIPAAGNAIEVEPKAGPSLPAILLGGWLAGAAAVLGLAVSKHQKFDKNLRRCLVARDSELLDEVNRVARLAGVRSVPPVVLIAPGTTPAITGCFRPRLLLPEDWKQCFDGKALRHVLLHELLHLRHGDLGCNWMALALQTMHWFNPLVWVAMAKAQADREMRCDAGALALLSSNERFDYGETLLRIQHSFLAPAAVAGLAPCVRNHPTLRQRILMITQPARHHPASQILFAAAFGIIACYAFTTGQAADNDPGLPAKDRSRETMRGEGAAASEKAGATREAEGGKAKSGDRDGGGNKTGMRDGERPRTGERDGDRPRTGSRDGKGSKTGMRDGERDGNRARTGPRDGERPATGEREGATANTGLRDGETAKGPGDGDHTGGASAGPIVISILADGATVKIGSDEIAMNRLRGFLNSHRPEHEGKAVVIHAAPGVTREISLQVMDAARDNGAKQISIVGE